MKRNKKKQKKYKSKRNYNTMKKDFQDEKDDYIAFRKPSFKENNSKKESLVKNETQILKEPSLDIYDFFKISKNEYNIDPFIIAPNMELINSTKIFREKNNFLYHKVLNKENIDFFESKYYDVQPDGNCFFRNISYFFTKNENYYII